MLLRGLRSLIRRGVHAAGYDVVPWTTANETLLGLAHLPLRTILDVGANTGQFARSILGVFPEAQLYCFEPLPSAFRQLRSFAETSGRRIRTIAFGLGDAPGTTSLNVHLDHDPSSSLLGSTSTLVERYPFTARQGTVKVEIRTLDALVADGSVVLQPEVLLKLDVQGYEAHVLRGAESVLPRVRASIAEVNLDRLYDGQATFRELVELYGRAGLRYAGALDQQFAPDGHVCYFDAVFVRDD